MEGMDLWTSMFSADFEEEEYGEGESHNNEFMAEEEEEEHEAEVDECDERNNTKDKGQEPDDDAIFDFEIKPIVSIADSEPDFEAEPARRPNAAPLAPQMPTGPPVRPMRRHSQPTAFGSPLIVRPGPGAASTRPTTSQINATDENGVPINYELGVVYICPACGAEYRQQDLWKRHMNQMHQYNTRKGLNFVAMDKLYHRCLECNKRIAMHSRENLLKHKFTHLPFRCTKCYICKREYKYRQDLMVHLRMVHCDEVVAMMREGDTSAGRKTRNREPRHEQYISPYTLPASVIDGEEGIDANNEIIEPNAPARDEVNSSLDDDPSRISLGKKKLLTNPIDGSSNGKGKNSGAAEICEDYIHYMCPDCGTDCDTHAQWSQHIEFVHDYVSRRGLNFRSVDMQMQCLECKQFVIPNTMKTLRAHKFNHLPQPEWMRCKLCYQGYKEHHELVGHLLKHHHLDTLLPDVDGAEEPTHSTVVANAIDDNDDDNAVADDNGCDEESFPHCEDPPRRGGRISADDMYEPHIDYLCPQCGREFFEKKHWRTHVVQVHGMNDLSKLNFEVLSEWQLKCTECDKIITNAYGIQNAQQHRITHLPYKAYARCCKCHKSYTDRKGLVKHLATYHRVGYEPRKSTGGTGLGASTGSVGQAGAVTGQQSSKTQQQPRKQIVTVANETFEIIYLDEEDQSSSPGGNNNNINEENDFGEQMQADDDEYAIGPSATNRQLTASAGNLNANRYKCVDCGSLFPTQAALKTHISEEHDFMETKYSAKKFDNAEPTDEAASASAQTTTAATTSVKKSQHINTAGLSTVEQNYIFLCPSCGKAYKTQFEWRRHINEAHNFDKRQYLNMRQLDKYRYQCTQCKDIVCNSKLKGLQDHHFRHLPYRLYLKCLVCGTCYNHKPNITAHLRTRHNIFERELPCSRDQQQQSKPHYNFVMMKGDKEKDKEMQRMSATSTSPTPPATSSSSVVVAGRSLKQQPGLLATRPAGLNTLEDNISYHNAVDLDFITYFCPKCNKNFDSHAFWRKHIVEQHNYNSRQGLNFRQIDNHHYLCLECYKRVTVTHTKGAIGQLQSHKFRHLPYRSFKCLTCNGEFVRKQMFFKHLNRDTNRCDNKPLSGQENDEDGIDSAEIMLSIDESSVVSIAEDVDLEAYSLMCPQCGENFNSNRKESWREHINIEHGLGKREMLHLEKLDEELYRCTDCDEQLETKQLRVLQEHRFKHLPYAAYIRCQLCEQQTDGVGHGAAAAGLHSMCELQQHIRDLHPTAAENDEQMQSMLDDEDSQPANEDANGPYMPLPPHLLDDVEEHMEFEDQYLLG